MNMILFTINYLLATLHGFVHKRNPAKLHFWWSKWWSTIKLWGAPLADKPIYPIVVCRYIYVLRQNRLLHLVDIHDSTVMNRPPTLGFEWKIGYPFHPPVNDPIQTTIFWESVPIFRHPNWSNSSNLVIQIPIIWSSVSTNIKTFVDGY